MTEFIGQNMKFVRLGKDGVKRISRRRMRDTDMSTAKEDEKMAV